MMYCRSGNNQGFALPTLMMVMMILLLVATTIGYVGFSSLRVSEMDHDSNEALFAAEAGLVAAAEELSRNGVVADPFELELPNGTKAKVTTFINETIAPMKTVHGVEIPPGTVYLHLSLIHI